MRLVALLFAFLFIPASGCLLPCNMYQRDVTWEQDDVPLAQSGRTTQFDFDGMWGGISRSPEDNKLRLEVFSDDPVSHEDLVRYAEALFESKGWPEPRLEGAIEDAGCGDDY